MNGRLEGWKDEEIYQNIQSSILPFFHPSILPSSVVQFYREAAMGDDIPCFRCGTCCIAPDISTLSKPVGRPCRYLTAEHLCGIYADRPAVCRDYRPDEICVELQRISAEERVRYFLHVYELGNG